MSEDIFEKYAELAMERGLVSKGDDLKKKLEKNPRWDSQNISTIELLYGVKPDSPKEMEYKKNIVEVAHPNAVIVSPAHDPLNGLVENLNERNNILINIVNKTPDGHLTGRKYASDELVRSLVRIANEMDNRDAEELRVLADTCIEQMNKQAFSWKDVENFFTEKADDIAETGKGAAGGAAVGGVIGGILGGIFGVGAGALPGAYLGAQIGAVGGGLLAAITKTSPEAKNVAFNSKDTLDQLNDLIKKFPNNNFLTTLHGKIEALMGLATKYADLSNNPTGKIAETAEAKTITESYVAAMDEMLQIIAVFKGKAQAGEFADAPGVTEKIRSVVNLFMDDDVDDVIDSLNALARTINKAENGMKAVKAQAASPTPATPAATPAASTATAPKTKEEKDEFAELAELLKKYPQLMSRLTQK